MVLRRWLWVFLRSALKDTFAEGPCVGLGGHSAPERDVWREGGSFLPVQSPGCGELSLGRDKADPTGGKRISRKLPPGKAQGPSWSHFYVCRGTTGIS